MSARSRLEAYVVYESDADQPEFAARLAAFRVEVLAEGLTGPERAFLSFALGLAADAMASRGDEFTVEDDAALIFLRRMASTPVSASGESAGDETGEAERLLAELDRVRAERDELHSKADFWRESYRLAKGYTDDELNARVAIDEATTPHLPPCRFPSSPDCTCTAGGAS